ncbi:ankyrin-2-like isoform X5 [Corvus hawaiiensis]|uniref:ankyrin-2-like isoform X5 n=1 Tax=Corvus hawaiiensis TaxID=134902 RepID=UPI002018BD7E|nr:ankyrin-2-like isoform X5 [Corvus hawaiiensis]
MEKNYGSFLCLRTAQSSRRDLVSVLYRGSTDLLVQLWKAWMRCTMERDKTRKVCKMLFGQAAKAEASRSQTVQGEGMKAELREKWQTHTRTPAVPNSPTHAACVPARTRFWLIDCRQTQESVTFASQGYREIICVPYMAKFVVFAKSHDPIEARLRCFCMTDDKVDKTLEQQENFAEVARSRDVEVLEGKPIYVDCFGNLVPLTKSGQHHIFSFFAFKENRLPLFVKVRDSTQEPCGRLSFMKEPKSTRGLVHQAICNLNITLPIYTKESDSDPEPEEVDVTSEKNQQDDQEKTEERLAHIADHLGFSWTELARELDFTEEQIHQIRIENPNSLQDQSHALLKYWLERDGKHATDTNLTQCLTKINRMDIVHLMETSGIDPVQGHGPRAYTDTEQSMALDHSEGFSALQEEVHSSRHKQEQQRVSKDSEPTEQPPLVSEEDVSVTYSPFQDSTPRSEAEVSMAELLRQAHKEQVEAEFSGKPQDVPGKPSASQQEYFVTSPGTEQSVGAGKAASGKSAPSSTAKGEVQGAPLQPLSSAQRGDSPIIQEPEDPHLHREQLSPRRSSLVIVESTEEQVENSGRGCEEESLEKVTLSEPAVLSSASKFQSEPVEGRKVSKVIKTTVVHGERTEKHLGDASLASDLPSAKEDFEEDNTK